jgi:hypothetical protein
VSTALCSCCQAAELIVDIFSLIFPHQHRLHHPLSVANPTTTPSCCVTANAPLARKRKLGVISSFCDNAELSLIPDT